MENKTLELKCCIKDCGDEPISLITVMDGNKQVAQYAPCQTHETGTINAVQIKYAGYTITIADIPRG